jgi:hypothetical protein
MTNLIGTPNFRKPCRHIACRGLVDERAAKKKDRLGGGLSGMRPKRYAFKKASRPALIEVEQLFLFLLGCLLRLLRLLRFLGHVALRSPQSYFNASRQSTCIDSDYTKIAKLILRVSKRVNDAGGHPVGTEKTETHDQRSHCTAKGRPYPSI